MKWRHPRRYSARHKQTQQPEGSWQTRHSLIHGSCRDRGGSDRISVTAVLAVACLGALALAAPSRAAFPVAKNGRIAFDRYKDIYLVNPDGSTPLNLTGSAADDSAPDFSPDGRWVVFGSSAHDYSDDIFLMRSDGSGSELDLTPSDQPTSDFAPDFNPSFSPDGKRIIFTRDLDPGPAFHTDVFIMNADGSGQTDLTNRPSLDNVAGDFSPDGRRIVFQRTDGGDSDIFTMSLDGSDLVNLTATSSLNEVTPAFSPSGALIAFARFPDGSASFSDLFYMSAEGLGRFGAIQLTSTPDVGEIEPAYSPDNSRIAFHRIGTGVIHIPNEIWTINSDGTGATYVNGDSIGGDEHPSWEYIYNCAGRRATIVGSDAGEKIKGTKKGDVIVANGGQDKIKGKGGNDRICGGGGKDTLLGQKGKDKLKGGGGADLCKGGKGKDTASKCEVAKSI